MLRDTHMPAEMKAPNRATIQGVMQRLVLVVLLSVGVLFSRSADEPSIQPKPYILPDSDGRNIPLISGPVAGMDLCQTECDNLCALGRFKEEWRHSRHLSNAPEIGLALSGGGTRSAMFCLGVLAGLSEKGLLDQLDITSSVSG